MRASQTYMGFLLILCGCGQQTLQPAESSPRPHSSAISRSDEGILDKFRSRASAEELREFDRIRSSLTPQDQTRALEMILFKLTDHELFAIGVTQVEQPGHTDWVVAWSRDSGEGANAVARALNRAGTRGIASCGLGCAGWYVAREEFFTARQALLEEKDIEALGVTIVTPRFNPNPSNH